MRIKKILISLGISCFIFIGCCNISNAALQANGSAGATKSLDAWLIQMRSMEQVGGVLGLEETIDSSTLLSTSGSNNVDVHMEKNTEYGTIAILSASSYGNPEKIETGGTTTGNKSGVVMNLNKEWVAAGSLISVGQFVNANARYKNVYPSTTTGEQPWVLAYIAKAGDTITETAGWHGSASSIWISSQMERGHGAKEVAGLLRAYSGSIFSYYGKAHLDVAYAGKDYYGDARYSKTWYSRAIMICGEGV